MDYARYFPDRIKSAVSRIKDGYAERVQEYRFRANRPLAVFIGSESRYLTQNGELAVTPRDALTVTPGDIRGIFEAVCRYSVHSFSREIANGFITAEGGHRVGICGTAVGNGDFIDTVKSVSGLNFRVAREVTGCSDELCNAVFSRGLQSLLIAGAPSSGKTTVLRDLCRKLGNTYKVSVIDERGELAAVSDGIPQNDVGFHTDIFDGYPKSAGIETAIRVMSPQVIVCDEIGNAGDAEALERAAVCGVKVIAAVHAEDMSDLNRKRLDLSLFDYIAFLGGRGLVKEIVRNEEYAEARRMRRDNDNNRHDRRVLFGGA